MRVVQARPVLARCPCPAQCATGSNRTGQGEAHVTTGNPFRYSGTGTGDPFRYSGTGTWRDRVALPDVHACPVSHWGRPRDVLITVR